MERNLKNKTHCRTKGFVAAILLIFATLPWLAACDAEDGFNTPEQKIQQFVSQYYPGTPIDNESTLTDGEIQVVLKNSATILFDANGSWLSVDGNGVVLPSVLLFDQLPGKLYDYIEEMEATDGVYRIFRNSTIYTVTFLDSAIQYEIASGSISYITSDRNEVG